MHQFDSQKYRSTPTLHALFSPIMFPAKLGRASLTLVVILVAVMYASLSVSGGPIPSRATREGKRFQCADETHFFTIDDSDSVTQCPSGTVCRASSHGSPCVFPGGEWAPDSQTPPAMPEDSQSPANPIIDGHKPSDTASSINPPLDTSNPGGEDTCDAEEEVNMPDQPSDTTSAEVGIATAEAEHAQTAVTPPLTEVVAPTDAITPEATTTLSEGAGITLEPVPMPQETSTLPAERQEAPPGPEVPQDTATLPNEQSTDGEQVRPPDAEPQGRVTDASNDASAGQSATVVSAVPSSRQ